MAEITSIPGPSDQHWKDLVTGKMDKPMQMLALKIMLTRLVGSTKADPSPANVEKCAKEVHEFFEKNIKLAQADLATILA